MSLWDDDAGPCTVGGTCYGAVPYDVHEIEVEGYARRYLGSSTRDSYLRAVASGRIAPVRPGDGPARPYDTNRIPDGTDPVGELRRWHLTLPAARAVFARAEEIVAAEGEPRTYRVTTDDVGAPASEFRVTLWRLVRMGRDTGGGPGRPLTTDDLRAAAGAAGIPWGQP